MSFSSRLQVSESDEKLCFLITLSLPLFIHCCRMPALNPLARLSVDILLFSSGKCVFRVCGCFFGFGGGFFVCLNLFRAFFMFWNFCSGVISVRISFSFCSDCNLAIFSWFFYSFELF